MNSLVVLAKGPEITRPPPRGNASFAWVQYFIYHVAATGMGGLRPR